MKKQHVKNLGRLILVVLFIAFLILKLTGNIDWSWWWVTAPLWISPLAPIICAILGFLFVFIKYQLIKIKKYLCIN